MQFTGCITETRLPLSRQSSVRHVNAHVSRTNTVTFAQQSQTTVIERRAADVVVIGSSYTAAAASYSLARRGKKVVWLSNFTSPAAKYRLEGLKPLHLPSNVETIVQYTSEAAAYWRGMQNLSPQTFFHMCGTVDIGPFKGESDAGDALGALHDATKAAGVQVGLMRVDEVAALFPQIKLPNGFNCLHQREGGVLDCGAAFSSIADLASRQGVLLRGNLLLRGWKDCDGFFSVRASSELLPFTESVFESEHILLAPEVGDWMEEWEGLFGLQTELQVRQARLVRCPVTEATAPHPVWRWLGSGVTRDKEEEAKEEDMVLGCWGVPTPGRSVMRVAQAPGKGQHQNAQAGATAADRSIADRLQGVCTSLIKGTAEADREGTIQGSVVNHICTPDGLPLLGSHPGFEEGRMLLAATTSGGFLGGIDGYQLSPLLAKAAVDIIQGSGGGMLDADRCSLSRKGVGATTLPIVFDTWSELGAQWRNRRQSKPEEQIREENAAEEQQQSKNTKAKKQYFM